jgi:hypothetical protein
MIVQPGEKIHVVFRQLFEGDFKRHFIGNVDQCEGTLVRATGYLFAEETKVNRGGIFVKQEDVRVRIIPLDCESFIVNVLPKAVNIETITYNYNVAKGLIRVTDGSDWHLDLSHA